MNVIRITKQEANKLKRMGILIGTNGISRTYGHHKTYYLCESFRNLECLKRLRQEEVL